MIIQLRTFEYRYIVEKFHVLRKLELSPAYNRHNRRKVYDSLTSSSNSEGNNKAKFSPSALWRESFVGWCYKIVDLCEFYFNRETVDIAISYLDQYLCKKGADIFDDNTDDSDDDDNGNNRNNNNGEQQPSEPTRRNLKILIISSACIFMAIKLHESNHHFDIPTLVRLNHGHFTRQDIVDAERDIMTAVDFRLSPPTVMSFIRIYLSFLDGGKSIDGHDPLTEKAMNHVTGLAKFLSELSIYDLFFVDKEVSKIALACVLTAFEGISRDAFPQAYRQKVVDCVFKEGKLDCTDKGVYVCRIKLRKMFEARRPGGIRNNDRSSSLRDRNSNHNLDPSPRSESQSLSSSSAPQPQQQGPPSGAPASSSRQQQEQQEQDQPPARPSLSQQEGQDQNGSSTSRNIVNDRVDEIAEVHVHQPAAPAAAAAPVEAEVVQEISTSQNLEESESPCPARIPAFSRPAIVERTGSLRSVTSSTTASTSSGDHGPPPPPLVVPMGRNHDGNGTGTQEQERSDERLNADRKRRMFAKALPPRSGKRPRSL